MAFRQKSVSVHQFAMVPRADIPRSSFRMQKNLKTTFDSGYLVPIYCEEVLPGDSFNVSATLFGRLATPIYPLMDNLHLETFFFFVPNRLVWSNWKRFMGEQDNPSSSISYLVPVIESPPGGHASGSIYDYFGIPCSGQILPGQTIEHSALPFRAYNLIWNEWFRDQNIQNPPSLVRGDGPDLDSSYALLRRGKRHDYFTSCLPWLQKGSSVSLPLGQTAPVIPSTPHAAPTFWNLGDGNTASGLMRESGSAFARATVSLPTSTSGAQALGWDDPSLVADLSAATAATINQIRLSFQVQKLLERDARGGTRYAEIVRSHFGVVSPDARLQRPEYLGGGHSAITMQEVPQTSATGVQGGTTPQGQLSAFATVLGHGHGFRGSFTEHGYVIGLVNVRADLTYQQGLRRHWSRQTRYDFYFPAFAMLGEQAVLGKEIYCRGTSNDNDVFGYQERWAEYRYNPSEITGLFRSTTSGTLDGWHLAQHFTSRPVLNSAFMQENPPVQRVVAVGGQANGQELLLDVFFDCKLARPLPLYSVPGLVDHF